VSEINIDSWMNRFGQNVGKRESAATFLLLWKVMNNIYGCDIHNQILAILLPNIDFHTKNGLLPLLEVRFTQLDTPITSHQHQPRFHSWYLLLYLFPSSITKTTTATGPNLAHSSCVGLVLASSSL